STACIRQGNAGLTPTITASSSVATTRSCSTVAGPFDRMWARFAPLPLIAVSNPCITAAVWSIPDPIESSTWTSPLSTRFVSAICRSMGARCRSASRRSLAATGPAAIQVDVLGSHQPVRADGGGGVGMKLTGIAGVDGHPDQGIAVLVVDPVDRSDARTAQLDPGTRVELAVGTRLHAEVQAVA